MSSPTMNESRTPQPSAVVGLLLILPIAMLAFGAVHVPARAGLALLAAFVGGMLARRGRFQQHKG